jgi:hypothetical protein
MKPFSRRLILPLIALFLLTGLSLDLGNRGLVWQALWNLTGEEEPASQLLGFVYYLGNYIRRQPDTQPMTPINHADVSPFGINTFLQQEVEVAKRERSLQLIREAGFTMIRQQFPWEDIEIHGRGDFTDRRNDLNGDGTPDAISAWAKYDNIVDLAEQYGITIQARLDNPPAWTHADPAIGSFAPPDDLQDFVNYAVAVAERYRGRIRYYQIWNEPNIYPEWGEQPVSAVGYTELLCRAYDALKAVDENIVVISGPLSPTVSLTDRNLNDFLFLDQMYRAGAGRCFDVMSAQGYGFYSGPTDRRMRPFTLTYARHLYIRDIMVVHGDAHKSIWISEAAWNPQPEDPSIVTSQYGNFGIVTPEQAARYMPLAYQRAGEEWPWLGNISYWFFKRAADYERNQAFYYFRMMEPDFTPLPVFDAVKQYTASLTPTLYAGVHQAEDWAVERAGGAPLVEADGAEFGQAVLLAATSDAADCGEHVAFITHGTAVRLRLWRDEHTSFIVSMDERLIDLGDALRGQSGWVNIGVPEAGSLLRQTHRWLICPGTAGDGLVRVDSITVVDRSSNHLYLLGGALLVTAGMLGLAVWNGWRGRTKHPLSNL